MEKIKYVFKYVLFSYAFCTVVCGFSLFLLPKIEMEEIFLQNFRELIFSISKILRILLPFIIVLYGINTDLDLKPRVNKVPTPRSIYSIFSPFNKNEWIMCSNIVKKTVNNSNSWWYKGIQLELFFLVGLPYRIIFCNPITFYFPQAFVLSIVMMFMVCGGDFDTITGMNYLGIFLTYLLIDLGELYLVNSVINHFPSVKNEIKNFVGDEETLYFFAGYYFDRTKILLSFQVLKGLVYFYIACLLLEPAFTYPFRMKYYYSYVKDLEERFPHLFLEDNAHQRIQELVLNMFPTKLEFLYAKLKFFISLIL